MKTINPQAIPSPPSLISALLGGFDAIANHIGVILFPALLDLFLWLGPRLRLKEVLSGSLQEMAAQLGAASSDMSVMTEQIRELGTLLAERFNLFSTLRSYPVGIPILMTTSAAETLPFGPVLNLEVPSLGTGLGIWFLLNLLGLLLGSLYFIVVTQAAFFEHIDWAQVLLQWPWAAFQVVLLALFWAVLLMAVSLPASCLLPFIALGGPSASRIGFFLYGMLLLWLLFPLLLSPYGIFLNGRKMWASVQDGFRLTRVTYPYTLLLFIMILVLSQGLNLLWTLPPTSSWLAVVGIFGHAFVATGLLAATLIYYREATRWMQRVQQQMKIFST